MSFDDLVREWIGATDPAPTASQAGEWIASHPQKPPWWEELCDLLSAWPKDRPFPPPLWARPKPDEPRVPPNRKNHEPRVPWSKNQITAKEAAKILGTRVDDLYSLVRTGRLMARKVRVDVNRKVWRFSRKNVLRLRNSGAWKPPKRNYWKRDERAAKEMARRYARAEVREHSPTLYARFVEVPLARRLPISSLDQEARPLDADASLEWPECPDFRDAWISMVRNHGRRAMAIKRQRLRAVALVLLCRSRCPTTGA